MTPISDEKSIHESIPFASKLEERVIFFFVCMGIISLTYGFLFLVDFLPEKPETKEESKEQVATTPADPELVPVVEEVLVEVDPLPVRIIFDTLDKEAAVLNPLTDDVVTLDVELLKGVVRHPDSADFSDTGTIFLLGHSSYLPSVMNKNFQAFNGIQKLKWGDTIRLQSGDMEYVYSVDRVYEAKAADAKVDIVWGEAKLVLATCNSFGTKDDRFVVEASLVETRPLAS